MVPAPAPATAPAVDGEDEGGGGAKNQNNMVVVKSEDVCTGALVDGGASLAPCSTPAGGDQAVGVPDQVVVDPEPVKDDGGDTTECSSSFGDTCSGFHDEADGGEPEVNSQISDPVNGGGASRTPRKKKVTVEWRNAVRPILWRCQWLELRMKDLSSQVSKYDRELALIKREKEQQQSVSKTNGSTPESLQICKGRGSSTMKRRTRKRHEETVDTSLYIKKHQILSYYYDKQNKGAETDSLLIDDDCSSAVNRGITGGLDTVALLDAEEYDMIFEQLALKNILSTIDGVQSQVHSLQDRLRKAHLGEEKLAFSEENTQVRVARKRQSTQKHSFSYKTYRYTKPQKRKNLNILLKDDDGPAFATRTALTDRETNRQMGDAKGNTEEKSGELNHSGDRGITVDLLLGVHNSLPNGHMSDSCKENIDDILIDNQGANGGCQQFEKVKQPPPETLSKGQSSSAPVEVKNTSAALKVDNTSALVVKQETFPEKSPIKKQGQKSKKKKGRGSVSMSKKQSKERSKTHAPKQKTETTPSAAKKAESTPSSATEPETRYAGKKGKSGNKTAAAKKRKAGNSSSAAKQEIGESSPAAKKRKTENSFAAAKKQETENSPAAAKKQETENSPAAAKKQETESTPSKVMVEKAVLVAVSSRRSQRVRKPKVY